MKQNTQNKFKKEMGIKMSERSEKILRLMNESGLSYGELSKMTKIPKSALQRYATGETEKIPVDRIEILARALGCSSAYLMGWEDNAEGEEEFLFVGFGSEGGPRKIRSKKDADLIALHEIAKELSEEEIEVLIRFAQATLAKNKTE